MADVKVPIKFEIYKGDALVREEVLTQDVIKVGKLASSRLRIDDTGRQTSPMVVDQMHIDRPRAADGGADRDFPEFAAVVRVDRAYDIRHGGQNHNIVRTGRRRHVRENQRLRFEAPFIAGDLDLAEFGESGLFDARRGQFRLVRIPAASGVVGRSGRPRSKGRRVGACAGERRRSRRDPGALVGRQTPV